MFVRAVVVEHQMQREDARRLGIKLLEKGMPLLVGVTLGGLAEHLAVEVAQRGEQRERAVAHIDVGGGAHMAHAEGQSGLGALQRLALALLITAEDQRPVRRIEMQPDNIPDLASKFLSLESLKVRLRWGLMSLLLQRICTVWLLTPLARAILRVDH